MVFLELASNGSFRSQEEVLDQLLSEGAAPLTHTARFQVREHRPCDARQVDSVVAGEAPIFDREYGIDQVLRNAVDLDQFALLTLAAKIGTDELRLEQYGTDLA